MPGAVAAALPRLQRLLPPLHGEPVDLLLSLYLALAVMGARLVAERTVLPRVRRALKPHTTQERLDKQAFKVFENLFTAAFSGSLAIWAWYVTLADNGGCTPFSTKPCLSTWPDVPLTRQFQLVWLSILAYYTYEMIGTALRIGCVLGGEMVVHHVITMCMMMYGYFYGINRFGIMATALLDSSNTLLHAAKALNYADVPALAGAKDAVSKAFVAAFFVCRVVLPPFSLIRPGLLDGRAMPPAAYYTTNGLLLLIYGLQLFWFHKIMRIALGYDTHDGEPPATATATVTPRRAKGE